MVTTWAPLTLDTGVTQEGTALPFTCTVHAPHCAIPQPYLVPVSFSSSRITQSRGVLASDFDVTVLPFRVKAVMWSPSRGAILRCAASIINPAGETTAMQHAQFTVVCLRL